MLQSYHQNAEQFEILFNKTKYDALPAKMKAIIEYAVEAASADMSWKAIDRYSKDYIELQTKDKVKFYKTPDVILQKQLEVYDQIAAKKSADNPMFKEILESQIAFAKRAVAWDMDTNVNRRMAYNHYFGKKAPDRRKPNKRKVIGYSIIDQPSGRCCVRMADFWNRIEYAEITPYRSTRSARSSGRRFPGSSCRLTFLITYEVFARYALDAPHSWAFDIMLQMYGTLFMMAGAYTLSKNGMVRGDVLYGFFPPRLQAALDLTLYFLFFIPGVTALCWAGYDYAGDSWRIFEHSSITADGPPLYHFKTIIPIAGAFLLVQGFVEMIRCVLCLKDGKWPSRIQDVEEVDVEKLKATVHVTDEDIAKLDEIVTHGERGATNEKRSLVWNIDYGDGGDRCVLGDARRCHS